MPTVTPAPSTPKSARASAAASWASPSELTEPQAPAADRGREPRVALSTPATRGERAQVGRAWPRR